MALKDWKKSGKYNKKSYTMYINKLPQYKRFENNYYLTIGNVGDTKKYYVSITKNGKGNSKEFDTYNKALSYAKSYMRKH